MRKLSLRRGLAGQASALGPHLVRRLPRAAHHFADATHRLAVARHHADRAEIVEHVLGRDRFAANPALGERDILGDVLVEVMADHQHVEMLVERVHRVRPRGVGRAGQNVRLAADPDDVGRVAAARTLGVIRVDRPSLERGDRIVDVARLVQRVGVNRHLDVVAIGHGQAAVDGRGRRAPVLVQLEADRAGADLLVEPFGLATCCPCRGTRSSSAARRSPAASARHGAHRACRSSRSCPSPARSRRQ